MRDILVVRFINYEGQSHKTVSTDHNLFEQKGEQKRNRAEVLLLTGLTPYRQAKPAHAHKQHATVISLAGRPALPRSRNGLTVRLV